MHFRIEAPDDGLRDALGAQTVRIAGPAAAPGLIEALAIQIGLAQQTLQPAIRQPAMMIFAGDHGAIAAGASALPQKLTWQTVERVLAGQAALNVACRQMALALSVIDAGVGHDFSARPGLIAAKIEHGTANFALDPAMWRSQLDRALAHGRDLAHDLAARGGNAIGFGAIGVGAHASAALLAHCLTPLALDDLAGADAHGGDTARSHRLALLERASARAGRISDPLEALREYGGFEIAMMVGSMLGAAEKRMLVVADGFVVTAAAIVARAMAADFPAYCVVPARSTEPGHEHLIAAFGATPLLAMPVSSGDGIGAALAFPMLRTAAGCLRDTIGRSPAGAERQRP